MLLRQQVQRAAGGEGIGPAPPAVQRLQAPLPEPAVQQHHQLQGRLGEHLPRTLGQVSDDCRSAYIITLSLLTRRRDQPQHRSSV